MAKSHRSTSISFPRQLNKAHQKRRARFVSSLYEIFDNDAEDPKGWLLTWAESVAGGGGIHLLSFLPRALNAFLAEHANDFAADPQKYRVPTEDEDQLNMALASCETAFVSPYLSAENDCENLLEGWLNLTNRDVVQLFIDDTIRYLDNETE